MMGEPAPVFVNYEDLLEQARQALDVSNYLSDRYDSNTGTYLGKDITPIEAIFNILNITDFKEEILGFIKIIESAVVKQSGDKSKQQQDIAKQQSASK